LSLRYLSYGPHYEHVFEEVLATGSVLFFDPRSERSREPIGDRVREQEDELRGIDLLILRGSDPQFEQAVREDVVLPTLTKGTPVLCLSPQWEAGNCEPRLWRPDWTAEGDLAPEVADLRALEILAMLEESGAIFEQERCHYWLPSGLHASAFIRLADALRDHTDIVRVADWLLPRLDARTGLMADTGSLIALLTVTASEATRRFGWDPLPIATLRGYATVDHLDEVVSSFRIQMWHRLLFVISVSSSGRVAELVGNLEDDVDVVTVCSTGERPRVGEVFSEYPVTRWKPESDGNCEKCRDLQILHVDRTSYEIRTDLNWIPQRLDTSIAIRQSEFWEAVDECAALALHVERPMSEGDMRSSRHLAVWIDIGRLLAHESFRRRAVSKLAEQEPPNVLIVPDHAETEALVALAREAFPGQEMAVLGFRHDRFDESERDVLVGAERILVLDDALISGSTLYAIQRQLHDVRLERDHDLDYQAFVILSRPHDMSVEKAVMRRYGYKPAQPDQNPVDVHYASVERVILPRARDCSFCAERRLLVSRLERLAGSHQLVERRIAQLSTAPEGMVPPLFMGGTEGDRPTVGSFFGKLSPVTAFAAAASVAQTQKIGFAHTRRAATVHVLDSPLTNEAFFDPVLAGGVLRTFDARDLRSPGQDLEFDAKLEDRATQFRRGSIMEIALAAILGKLPDGGIRHQLERRAGEDPVAQALLHLLVVG
jgi:hypothetical protein